MTTPPKPGNNFDFPDAKKINTLCVFCASSDLVDGAYKDAARTLGRRLGELGIDLIFGGGGVGLMGEVARSAHDNGGKVIGVLPDFLKTLEVQYPLADEMIVPKSMRERKGIMDELSDAFIVLPGGIGTFEEALEILTLKHLGQCEKPLVFVDIDNFFAGFYSLLEDLVRRKFTRSRILDQFVSFPDVDSALSYILGAGQTPGGKV